jgi:ring-1,2-phenylacetyl-CoA epoxidase subunit PaaC
VTAEIEARRPTRTTAAVDVPPFETSGLAPELREALFELLLTLADDDFVQGFRDSEWTGIAPMLEEDVAFSSIAQDEIGHARAFYEMAAILEGGNADELAFGRRVEAYRHARLLDHPRNGWAFSVTRRWLYDTADAVRLAALAESSFAPLAQLVGKIRREERYHLLHLDAWLERLASRPGPPRGKLLTALKQLFPDALSVFTPLPHERVLLDEGVLALPMAELAARWREEANQRLCSLNLRSVPDGPPPLDGRDHQPVAAGFRWLWEQFTAVRTLDPEAEW